MNIIQEYIPTFYYNVKSRSKRKKAQVSDSMEMDKAAFSIKVRLQGLRQ